MKGTITALKRLYHEKFRKNAQGTTNYKGKLR